MICFVVTVKCILMSQNIVLYIVMVDVTLSSEKKLSVCDFFSERADNSVMYIYKCSPFSSNFSIPLV